MIAGFYHDGYEEPLLMLMRRQPVEAGLVVKVGQGARSGHAILLIKKICEKKDMYSELCLASWFVFCSLGGGGVSHAG